MNQIIDCTKGVLSTTRGKIGAGTLTVGTAALAYYLYSQSSPNPRNPFDLNCQSVETKDGGRRLASVKDDEYVGYLYEDVRTLYECFQRGLKLSRHKKCLGTRNSHDGKYEWLTYQQVYDRAHAFGSGLLELGLLPNPQTFIGIYTANCVEWVTTEQACNMFSMVIVPLYDTLGPDACKYVINLTEMETVICDTQQKVQSLLDQAEHLPSLKRIILIDKFTNNNVNVAKSRNISLYTYQDIEIMGSKRLHDPVPPKPSDLTTICFTSGTTGDPKGVLLTHENHIAHISGIFSMVKTYLDFSSDDSHISYLPLSHSFERAMQINAFMHGYHIGFYSGDIRKLFDDIKELKPTIFPTVPRLLNRLYDKVHGSCEGKPLKQFLLNTAINRKITQVKRGIVRGDTVWDYMVLNKVRNMTGGRIKLLVTSSAPLSEDVMNFTRAVFGCTVLEAYGQTEATAAVSCTIPCDTTPGHVGAPTLCNKIKLADVPEMEYYSKDRKGEVCVKGLNVFQGYYKNPEKTAEALDKDGWLHTGDIGTWLPNGTLKIIDRKKHIFKLCQGEYIAPEKIENVYAKSKYVAQVFVDGDSLKAFCMGVVTLDMEVIDQIRTQHNLPSDNIELCKSQKTKDLVLSDMLAVGKSSKLKGFEQVKDIYVFPEPFSLQNGLLTPTFKNKRPQLRQKFSREMELLYSKHSK